jgi:hypothetical protein
MISQPGTLAQVEGFVADTSGVVFTEIGGTAETINASSPSGTLSTLFTAPSGLVLLDLALDGQTVYYLGTSSGTNGVYSIPRAGGTPTTVTTGDRTQLFLWIALDDANLYVSEETQPAGSSTRTGSILQIPKASGVATTIYTAPSGQLINHLVVDSGTLFWSETDIPDNSGAATIRSATVGGGPLSPTTLLNLPAPSGLYDLKVSGGWVLGAKETVSNGPPTDGGVGINLPDGGTITIGTGVFAVPRTGGPLVVVDPAAIAPIAIGPGVVFMTHGNALAKATVSASGFGTPSVIVSGVFVTTLAADEHGTVYYISPTDGKLYKL